MVGDIANTTCVDAVLASARLIVVRPTARRSTSRRGWNGSRSVGMLDYLTRKQSRRAEYNRPDGFAMLGPDGRQYPVQARLLLLPRAATKLTR
jgi:hypothetical protein